MSKRKSSSEDLDLEKVLDETVEQNIMHSDKTENNESEHDKDVTDDNNNEDTRDSMENEQKELTENDVKDDSIKDNKMECTENEQKEVTEDDVKEDSIKDNKTECRENETKEATKHDVKEDSIKANKMESTEKNETENIMPTDDDDKKPLQRSLRNQKAESSSSSSKDDEDSSSSGSSGDSEPPKKKKREILEIGLMIQGLRPNCQGRYVCPKRKCGKDYGTKRAVHRHLQNNHSGNKRFYCMERSAGGTDCIHDYPSQQLLDQHQRGIHGEGFIAYCGKSYQWPLERSEHQSDCKKCAKYFED